MKKKKRLSIVNRIFAVFFGILLFAGVLAWIVASQLEDLVEPKKLASAVTDSLDFEEMDVTEMFEDATNGKSLSEFINEQASELSGEDLQLTDDDIKVILNNKAVKSFLEDKLSDYAAFIAGDDKEANAALSSDELYSLIEDNKGVIESATGKKLDNKAMDKIRTDRKSTRLNSSHSV